MDNLLFGLYANSILSFDSNRDYKETRYGTASCFEFKLCSISTIDTDVKNDLIKCFDSLLKVVDKENCQEILTYVRLIYSSSLIRLFLFNPVLRLSQDKISNDLKICHDFIDFDINFITPELAFKYSNFIRNNLDVHSSLINLLNEIKFFLDAEYRLDDDCIYFYDLESGESIV